MFYVYVRRADGVWIQTLNGDANYDKAGKIAQWIAKRQSVYGVKLVWHNLY